MSKHRTRLYRLVLLVLVSAAVLFTNAADTESRRIKAMLLTGQMNNYHDWQVTSARIEKLLEDSGRVTIPLPENFPTAGKVSIQK